jgi:hypothetical protein
MSPYRQLQEQEIRIASARAVCCARPDVHNLGRSGHLIMGASPPPRVPANLSLSGRTQSRPVRLGSVRQGRRRVRSPAVGPDPGYATHRGRPGPRPGSDHASAHHRYGHNTALSCCNAVRILPRPVHQTWECANRSGSRVVGGSGWSLKGQSFVLSGERDLEVGQEGAVCTDLDLVDEPFEEGLALVGAAVVEDVLDPLADLGEVAGCGFSRSGAPRSGRARSPRGT